MTDKPDLTAFLGLVHDRLAKGEREYRGRSFSRHPADLAAEVEQELADIVGWTFILWARVRALRDHLSGSNGATDSREGGCRE